ncbi:hypothetical protein CDL12_13254 [Handroanthus impetiginosus]|uniref:Uncharacterized protein n=1 Tax=Handroanthus impetiginosus TaxID=429701 RepID=A0A2G9H9E1_9LAMI|nr:hypothetical protein CDL12_13254 [Handroanthus impetiginosus]
MKGMKSTLMKLMMRCLTKLTAVTFLTRWYLKFWSAKSMYGISCRQEFRRQQLGIILCNYTRTSTPADCNTSYSFGVSSCPSRR